MAVPRSQLGVFKRICLVLLGLFIGQTATPQGDWFAAQLSHIPPRVQFRFILYHLPWMADKQLQAEAALSLPHAFPRRADSPCPTM